MGSENVRSSKVIDALRPSTVSYRPGSAKIAAGKGLVQTAYKARHGCGTIAILAETQGKTCIHAWSARCQGVEELLAQPMQQPADARRDQRDSISRPTDSPSILAHTYLHSSSQNVVLGRSLYRDSEHEVIRFSRSAMWTVDLQGAITSTDGRAAVNRAGS